MPISTCWPCPRGRNARAWVAAWCCGWKSPPRVAGITDVYLEVRAQNLPARQFYESLGYVEFEEIRGFYAGQETAVRMAHDLRVNSA